MLRAGPFSDERILRLANRRFVPFYFDLSTRGAAGDADAREFVIGARAELGGSGIAPPPVMFMTPEGKILGEAGNFVTADEVLREMRRVLRENPEFDLAPAIEKDAKTPMQRAEIQFDLGDYAAVEMTLRTDKTPEAICLKAKAARFDGRWEAMEKHLSALKSGEMENDVRVERAWRLWHGKEFEKLREHLKEFPKSSPRYTEARYLEGLAVFHAGKQEDALEIWERTIRGADEDRWVYRADWAWGTLKFEGRKRFSDAPGDRTPLGRIGYLGGKNPDLQGP
ncbi:MAG: hypothetical protein FD180_3542 [Planctomycetota bacterium]|nr:MAG: hypothetical protein FD180_3542 [Planctomycetota bacterium]